MLAGEPTVVRVDAVRNVQVSRECFVFSARFFETKSLEISDFSPAGEHCFWKRSLQKLICHVNGFGPLILRDVESQSSEHCICLDRRPCKSLPRLCDPEQ